MLDTAHPAKGWAVLVELSVMSQRYQAVLPVLQDGWNVTEVVERLGVSRQRIHAWIARCEAGGHPRGPVPPAAAFGDGRDGRRRAGRRIV